MTHPLINKFEESQVKDSVADIQVGDTVVVHKVNMEGKKQRTQRFQGTVIKLKGSLSRKSFTVRKIIDGVGAIVSFKNTSGMIHISKLSPLRATSVEQFVKMGDMVDFTVIQVDLAKGRIGLARTPSAEEVKQYEESRKPKVEAPKKTEEK